MKIVDNSSKTYQTLKQLIVTGFLVQLLSACEKQEENQKNFTAGSLGNNKAYCLN